MSDHDKDREGGGLAVLIAVAFLALLLLGVGGGMFLFRRLAIEQRIAVEHGEIVVDEAAPAAPIEIPVLSAPESPESTQ